MAVWVDKEYENLFRITKLLFIRAIMNIIDSKS